MNGRMLWWEDGYDQYNRLDLRSKYRHASPAAARASCRDWTSANSDPQPWTVLQNSGAPDWPVRSVPTQRCTLALPTTSPKWTVTFHDTHSGEVTSTTDVDVRDGQLAVSLPRFESSLAFIARSQ